MVVWLGNMLIGCYRGLQKGLQKALSSFGLVACLLAWHAHVFTMHQTCSRQGSLAPPGPVRGDLSLIQSKCDLSFQSTIYWPVRTAASGYHAAQCCGQSQSLGAFSMHHRG